MNRIRRHLLVLVGAALVAAGAAASIGVAAPRPTPLQPANALLAQMTRDEKISLVANGGAGVPRLGIPALAPTSTSRWRRIRFILRGYAGRSFDVNQNCAESGTSDSQRAARRARRTSVRSRRFTFHWRARYILIFAALSSIASPVTSTRAFFTVPVNANGAL